jgi:hypothetical protein
MDQDEVNDIPSSLAEEFWAALATNDRNGAQQVVDRLALPPVETSAFLFEEVEGELEQVRGEEGGDGGSGALSPKAVNSDTPVAVVETWNSDVRVALVLVSKDEICGARVSDGEVDFHACAGASIGRVEPPVDGPRTRLMEKTPRGAKSSRWNFLLPGSGHSLSPSSRQARPSSTRRFSLFRSCLKISSRMTSFSLRAGMRRFLLCGFAPESGSSSSKLMEGETGSFNYGRGRRELQGRR